MRRLAAFMIAATLTACADKQRDGVAEEKLGVGAEVAADMQLSSAPAPEPAPSPLQSARMVRDTTRGLMLIRNGNARVEVDSLELAIAALHNLAQRLGGIVSGVATQTGNERIREATLTLRIPAQHFDQAVGGLEPIGSVESINITSEDVGEEYVDVGVRLENGRRLERRLLELLQTRTGKLEEVLAVERELARVREEIERYEARMRYLRNRVAISTLTVTIHEPVPLLSDYQGRNVVLRSFGRAWRNFVGLVAGLIASLGIVIPIGVVVTVVWILIRRRR